MPKRKKKIFGVKWLDRLVAIDRVTKVVKGGKKISFRATIVMGNSRGSVGVGIGKAGDVSTAINNGKKDARRHQILIPLTNY